ncbi:hypothetical protein ACWEGQ_01345 [Streptomyces seoulensis]
MAGLEAMWAEIELVVPRDELVAAIVVPVELTPPLDSVADKAWRIMPANRFGTVRRSNARTACSLPTPNGDEVERQAQGV